MTKYGSMTWQTIGVNIMKTRKLSALAGLIALAGIASVSHAAILWTDTISTDRYLDDDDNRTYTYTHDFRDGAGGFRPGIDIINFANLSVWLDDDSNSDGSDEVRFSFSGTSDTFQYEVDQDDTYNFTVGASLLNTGLFSVTLRAREGDFWFRNSSLEVDGRRGVVTPPTSVPEPGTLALLGLGLAGLGLVRRKASR